MKGRDLGVAVAVILLTAAAIGGMLSYFKTNPQAPYSGTHPTTNGVTASSPVTTTKAYEAPGLQETGSVNSVDSGGGHFTLSNVGFGLNSSTGSPNFVVMVVNLSPSQTSLLTYGEDVEVRLSYVPVQQSMFDSFGKVTFESNNGGCPPTSVAYTPSNQPCAVIDLVNPTFPTAVPTGLNPKIGDEVTLSLSEETGTPIVAITGLQSEAWTGQFSAIVDSPSCLGSPPCVMIASGSQLPVALTLYFYCGNSCPVTVTSTNSALAISNVQQSNSGFGVQVTFNLAIPNSDFAGYLDLSFTSTSS